MERIDSRDDQGAAYSSDQSPLVEVPMRLRVQVWTWYLIEFRSSLQGDFPEIYKDRWGKVGSWDEKERRRQFCGVLWRFCGGTSQKGRTNE